MFTGLVEHKVQQKLLANGRGLQLEIQWPFETSPEMGESIAINGCCLTISAIDMPRVRFDLNQETQKITTLDRDHQIVNVERAMSAQSRFGGHIVSGHIDCTAQVHEITDLEGSWRLTIILPKTSEAYCIPKGSICLDGVSLTINKVYRNSDHLFLSVEIIPKTFASTNIECYKVGAEVNVEYDQLAKMIAKQISIHLNPSE